MLAAHYCRGQEYDVTGEEGKIYNLISEYYDSKETATLSLVVNAVFAEAYTTGLRLTADNEAKPFYESGTWISTVGILVGLYFLVEHLSSWSSGIENPLFSIFWSWSRNAGCGHSHQHFSEPAK